MEECGTAVILPRGDVDQIIFSNKVKKKKGGNNQRKNEVQGIARYGTTTTVLHCRDRVLRVMISVVLMQGTVRDGNLERKAQQSSSVYIYRAA